MSVTINAKGTSVPQFTIGKSGITLYQGSSNPSAANTIKDGDYWFDKSNRSLKVWNAVSSDWAAPRLADIRFIANAIVGPDNDSLILSAGTDHPIKFNSDSESATEITTDNPSGLNINPATGLYLNNQQWPVESGTAGQILTTDDQGLLSWVTLVIQKLSDIADVYAPGPVANGSLLVFDQTSQKWTATTTLNMQTVDGGEFTP